MHTVHCARWVSRERAAALRKAGTLKQAILLDMFNGRFILVAPPGDGLDDGTILTRDEADYELQPVWFTGPMTTLREARRRLGLEGQPAVLTA
jgi:hypothetical protein